MRGFFDSTNDGTGDLRGLTQKLDYLQWLGIDCLWLLPFYDSPLRDGGYDIADFFTVLPGVRRHRGRPATLIEEAHKRGIRVVADMVMNHTSRPAPLVPGVAARTATNPKADWYVWGDDDQRWSEARVIFVDTEPSNWTYDAQRGQYYWHRFFHHQPDLNYDNPEVADAMLDVVRFWLEPRPRRLPPRRRALPVRARRHQRREPARDPRVPAAPAQGRRRRVPGPGAAGRGQPVARGRGRLLRPGRGRVPHVLPLPAHAPHVHGRAPRAAAPDHGDPRPDPGDPRWLPVGHLPAQPRRADPRDGHRRGARLHVRRVRRRPAHAAQRRHRAAALPPARERPEPGASSSTRCCSRMPGQPRPVLRRRDRHGRQHLPRRPRRGAHADAVDARPQRRLLDRPTSRSSTCRR